MELITGNKTITLTPDRAENLWNRHRNAIREQSGYDLTDEAELRRHNGLLKSIGNNIMEREFRTFEIDEHNRHILRFLLYYFHGSPLMTTIFPDKNYMPHKNIMLVGGVGTGKTQIMEVFRVYLDLLKLPRAFENISQTQLLNYQKTYGHINRYTYNETGMGKSFEGNPFSVCLNDIGLETEKQKSFGTPLDLVIDEFLYARDELHQFHRKYTHLTTNLKGSDFNSERYGYRLMDRFKNYNIIFLGGDSRRK